MPQDRFAEIFLYFKILKLLKVWHVADARFWERHEPSADSVSNQIDSMTALSNQRLFVDMSTLPLKEWQPECKWADYAEVATSERGCCGNAVFCLFSQIWLTQ
jgi:hypothetical protein